MSSRPALVALCCACALATPLRASADPADPSAAASAPAAACPPIQEAVLGTWEPDPNGKGRKRIVEEYGPGGAWSINGIAGTVEWQPDGLGRFAVGGEPIGTYVIALTDVNEMVTVNATGGGTVYRRTSAAPAIAASCYDIADEIVGTWVAPAYTETYEADGTYRVNGRSGTWRFEGNGHLVVEVDGAVGWYWLALVGRDKAMAIAPDRRGVVSERR